MRSMAFINQKGGVGKTTTAVNVAAAMARSGQRVLLLDMDPQAHATMHLGVEIGEQDRSLYDVLVHRAPLAAAAQFADERVTVVPSHIDLVGAELELADREQRESLLQQALGPHYEHFDVLIIDCAPSLGVLTVNALAAVREVIIPLQTHFFALQGLGKLLETVELVRAHVNPALRISGVVLCMFESGTRLAQEVSQDVREFIDAATPDDAWYGARVFETCIRRNIKLAECPSFGKSVFAYAPQSNGAEDYAALANEILAHARPDGVVAQASAAGDSLPEAPQPSSDSSDGSPARRGTDGPADGAGDEKHGTAHDEARDAAARRDRAAS